MTTKPSWDGNARNERLFWKVVNRLLFYFWEFNDVNNRLNNNNYNLCVLFYKLRFIVCKPNKYGCHLVKLNLWYGV